MAYSSYEPTLLQAMKESLITNSKVDKFLKNTELQSNLIGKIAVEITQIHHMSISDAKVYIDGRTGRFKPGRKLIVCPSDKIKGLFNQLEAVTTEINNAPWTTIEQAISAVATKQNRVKSLLDTIKSQVGVAGAKEILARVMQEARRQTGIN